MQDGREANRSQLSEAFVNRELPKSREPFVLQTARTANLGPPNCYNENQTEPNRIPDSSTI